MQLDGNPSGTVLARQFPRRTGMDKLRKESAKQEIKGIGQQIKGKVQEGAGKLTGNLDREAEGNLNQAAGRVREKVGETGRKVADALDPDATDHDRERDR
jgi:uncharacterized protein YjbJ (UPF0337 family)